jgi:gliotoxin/aspirochlorine biosynthesis peptide synthetase
MPPSASGITATSPLTTIKETNGLAPANDGSIHPNPITSDYDSTLIDLFSQCVALYPDAAALEDQTQGQFLCRQITYHDLHVASNCFSQRLRDHGIVAGDIVPVLGRRSVDMVIALLAVLKLRACYVPIDLDSWGPDRINTTLSMIDSHILIALDSTLGASSRASEGYEVVVLNDWSSRKHINLDTTTNMQAIKAQLRDKTPTLPSPADDLAYIIFTSGKISLNIISLYICVSSPRCPAWPRNVLHELLRLSKSKLT